MEIKKISLNCNYVLTVLAVIILFYLLFFYKPEISKSTLEIIKNL